MPAAQTVFVTGATSGIGLATAIHLAKCGYDVFGSGRLVGKLATMQSAAQNAGVHVRPIMLDVTDDHSIHAARQAIIEQTNGYGLDILVNNAGYGEAGAIEEIPIDRLRKQFETNVIGLVAVTQTFLPEMRTRRFGRVINISSVVGKLALPLMSAYAASKHAVEALSDGMRMELIDAGIDVVIVAPGSIESNFASTVQSTVATWVSADSPYRKSYQRWANMHMMNGANRPPMLIAKAVQEAIESTHPKPRYAITIESRLVPGAVALLPKRALDAVMRRTLM